MDELVCGGEPARERVGVLVQEEPVSSLVLNEICPYDEVAIAAASLEDRMPSARAFLLAVGLFSTLGRSDAAAWGCDGHRAIAIIAEHLIGRTADQVRAVLAASPVDPGLKHFCEPVPSDIIADVATWADDFRDVEPATGAFHFIDYPLAVGGHTADHRPFCQSGACVIDATVAQFRILTTSADAAERAQALRFVIHLVGDVHQPLHAITNGDRGGNCLPVKYYTHVTVEDAKGNFRPNLHAVWDGETIRRFMQKHHLADAAALAAHIEGPGPPPGVQALAPTTSRVRAWARHSNRLARTIGYGHLPSSPPLEPESALELASCFENNHVGERMATLHEGVGSAYEQTSVPAILDQLRLAGERLAAVLKAAFPNP